MQVLIQNDDKIVLYFSRLGINDKVLMRFNSDQTLDNSFASSGIYAYDGLGYATSGVFQDPQKACRETYFCRQALCFSSFYLLFCPCRGSLLSTGAVVSAHFVTRFFLRLSKILVNRKLAIVYCCKPRVFSCLVVCSGRRGDQPTNIFDV